MSAILTTTFAAVAADSVYDIPLKDIDGKDASLKPYKGNVILVVNVAFLSAQVRVHAAIYRPGGHLYRNTPCKAW